MLTKITPPAKPPKEKGPGHQVTRVSAGPPAVRPLHAALRLLKAVRRRFLVAGYNCCSSGERVLIIGGCALPFSKLLNFQGVSGGAQPLIGFGEVLPAGRKYVLAKHWKRASRKLRAPAIDSSSCARESAGCRRWVRMHRPSSRKSGAWLRGVSGLG